jgi:CheY-like chemotaxis protein
LTYVNGQVTFALSPLIRGIPLARKILLADDSVTAQNMGRKILADAGYEVIAVNNGSAALKKIAELKPDLVILDVYMPGYSGLEVCQRLKESQESARIPVLLSVGKLEPFKPEEAQRVRADGYIVKPFEASELLSALSKLEDKVVPRAEPSKPGRFARAIAAAEESGRGMRIETSGDENGWKSRIGFPKQTAEPEEKVAEAAPISSPAKRDLRTVVETSAEKAAEKKDDARPAAETVVDVAALAPAGLPKDVTPEEVAAIAAAAARIQMVSAAIIDDPQTSETQTAETTSQVTPELVPARVEDTRSSPIEAQIEPQREPASSVEAAKAEPLPESSIYSSGEGAEDTQDVPVTMAATAESVIASSVGGSRWTAVSVALEAEESAVSLDQEMQKAYAAFSAGDSSAIATVPEVQASSAENSSSPTSTAVDVPVAHQETAPQPEPAQNPVTMDATPTPVEQVESAAALSSFVASNPEPVEPVSLPEPPITQPEAAVPAPVTAEFAPAEAPAEVSPVAEFSPSNPEPAPVAEFVNPVGETEVADSASIAQDLQPVEAASVASAPAPIVPRADDRAEQPAEQVAEPRFDSETVKSTAAAWASWRQIRDTGKDNPVAEAQPGEKAFDVPESAPAETSVRAVAAGAEQNPQEAAAAPESDNPKSVASIVDSVLADLRPKLMEEISRKMSEKK